MISWNSILKHFIANSLNILIGFCKHFIEFISLSLKAICIVNSEEEFGRRISKTVTKSNSTDKDSAKAKRKDLDTHVSNKSLDLKKCCEFDLKLIWILYLWEQQIISDKEWIAGKKSIIKC